ncbi:hypothetical protein [Chlorobium limicola]|uniref:hypothetical protein n=1 Tax=Chlorobium limicola TaxID=1092 RepID=UPI00032402F2|nr:hypothetical protein [Chlorobium limicola]
MIGLFPPDVLVEWRGKEVFQDTLLPVKVVFEDLAEDAIGDLAARQGTLAGSHSRIRRFRAKSESNSS